MLTTFRTRETLEISDQEDSGSGVSGAEVVVEPICNQVDKDVGQALAVLDTSLKDLQDASFGDSLEFFGNAIDFADTGRELTATEVDQRSNSDVGEMVPQVSQVLESESLSQMLCSAFLNTRKRQQVVMPWESELAKKIFKKDNLCEAFAGLVINLGAMGTTGIA